MNTKFSSCLSIINLVFILKFMILLQPANGALLPQDFYNSCNVTYACGSGLTGIGYPFRGSTDPAFCGHPGFVLECNSQNNYTFIEILKARFLVMAIDQTAQTMSLVRDDMILGSCPREMANTTLDFSILSYTDASTNYTFLYGCPDSDLPAGTTTCPNDNTVYVVEGYQGRGNCSHSVTVPVSLSGNQPRMDQVLWAGFEVSWIMDSKPCRDCTASNGRCGFDYSINQSTCLCPDSVSVSYSCPASESIFRPNPERIRSPGRKIAIIIAAIAAAGVLMVGTVTGIYMRKKKRRFRKDTEQTPEGGIRGTSKLFSKMDMELFLKHNENLAPKRYKYSELKKITNSFSDTLGKGGFGSVYKGKLTDGRLVAVKVLNDSKGNGEEFMNEVASISRTSHVNIVTLTGFCYEGSKRALIYEFMPNGSLEKFLNKTASSVTEGGLGWEKLFDITVGVAQGLEYLHQGCNTRILHLDIKPHNILLDKDLQPKISDFGLARLCPDRASIISMSVARGTVGYIAPEIVCPNFGGVSHKSDVYSFGMLMLEMVGGRKKLDSGDGNSSAEYFPGWIYKQLELSAAAADDDQVIGVSNEHQFVKRKLTIIGLWCIQTDPNQRPSISRVVEMLEGELESLQIPPKPHLFSPAELTDAHASTFDPTL